MADALVIIPARMAATRLPGKPLADIAGKPMVVRVLERAAAAGVGPVAVATDTPAIAEVAVAAGFRAVMTRADHPSGSDRVHEAANLLDPTGEHRVIINVQGDFPTLDPQAIAAVASLMDDPAVSIGTLGAVIHDDEEKTNPNVVKVVGAPLRPGRLRALYFTRATAPWGVGDLIHHVGIYGYRRPVLDAFVALPPSPLETREKLEQLRALEAGFRIDVALINEVPRGVDTPEDLARTRALFEAGKV